MYPLFAGDASGCFYCSEKKRFVSSVVLGVKKFGVLPAHYTTHKHRSFSLSLSETQATPHWKLACASRAAPRAIESHLPKTRAPPFAQKAGEQKQEETTACVHVDATEATSTRTTAAAGNAVPSDPSKTGTDGGGSMSRLSAKVNSDRAKGGVSRDVYTGYLKACGALVVSAAFVISVLAQVCARVGACV